MYNETAELRLFGQAQRNIITNTDDVSWPNGGLDLARYHYVCDFSFMQLSTGTGNCPLAQ